MARHAVAVNVAAVIDALRSQQDPKVGLIHIAVTGAKVGTVPIFRQTCRTSHFHNPGQMGP
ncbi:MAG: hypothetical protein ACF8NJ_07180, partial [Phycisphaerales bacterium JB038]